jgi:hypothetical protein
MLNKERISIKIQSWWRGTYFRYKRMPLIFYIIQKYLQDYNIQLSNNNNDGRVNSSNDEILIQDILQTKFNNYKDIIIKAKERFWYDIKVYDFVNKKYYVCNIKVTTTKTADNCCNLSGCLLSYTNEMLDYDKKYDNGYCAKNVIEKIKDNEFNKNKNKDYYFLVINKENTNEIIINSLLGLNKLTNNTNNLPFQIKWKNNKVYNFISIKYSINLYINCTKKNTINWKTKYLSDFTEIYEIN